MKNLQHDKLNSQDAAQAHEPQLADLELPEDEQLDEIRGGFQRTGVDDGGGGRTGGDWIMNHNETMAADA